MGLDEVQAAFWEAHKRFADELQRFAPLMQSIEVRSLEDAKNLDALGTQCFGQITVSIEEAAFWLKRMNTFLEKRSETYGNNSTD